MGYRGGLSWISHCSCQGGVMSRFSYQIQDAQGRLQGGQIEADDVRAAFISLESQGWTVISIRSAEGEELRQPEAMIAAPRIEPARHAPQTPAPPTVSPLELALQQRLPHLRQAAEWFVPVLRALAAEQPRRQREQLLQIASELPTGNVGVWRQRVATDSSWLLLLAKAAESRQLGPPLSACVASLGRRRTDRLSSWMGRTSWVYLLFSLLVAIGLLLFFSVSLAPQFEQLFSQFNTQLPWLTRLMLTVSQFMRRGAVPILLGAALVAWLAKIWVVRVGQSERLAKLPWWGVSLRLRLYVRWARALADLLRVQMPVDEALHVAGEIVGPAWLRTAATATPHAQPSTSPAGLPALIEYSLRQPGLTSEARSRVLDEIASMYDQQLRQRQRRFEALLQPLCFVFTGALVGIVLLSLMLPMLSLLMNISL